MTAYLEELVDRHQDVKITVTGSVVKIDGEAEAFTFSIEVEAQSSFMIAPTWMILSGV